MSLRGRRGVCLTGLAVPTANLWLTFRCRSARRQAEGQRKKEEGRMRPEDVTTKAKPETCKSAQARAQGTRPEETRGNQRPRDAMAGRAPSATLSRSMSSFCGLRCLRSVIFDAALPLADLANVRWRHALAFRSGIPHSTTGRQPKDAIPSSVCSGTDGYTKSA